LLVNINKKNKKQNFKQIKIVKLTLSKFKLNREYLYLKKIFTNKKHKKHLYYHTQEVKNTISITNMKKICEIFFFIILINNFTH